MMQRTVDSLWHRLCPSWAQLSSGEASRLLQTSKRLLPSCTNRNYTHATVPDRRRCAVTKRPNLVTDGTNVFHPGSRALVPTARCFTKKSSDIDHASLARIREAHQKYAANYKDESVAFLRLRLRAVAAQGGCQETRWLVEHLIREKGQPPDIHMYNALILCNIHAEDGAGWRVNELLAEMNSIGLVPDAQTCHAVLKVTSIHLDHLLRSDILEYMRSKWFTLSSDGAHDVAAGLFREAQFEKAIERLNLMRDEGMIIDCWLLDLAIYILCDAGEIGEAYKIARSRDDSTSNLINKSVYYALLDQGSQARHHAATKWVWSTQVNPGYINPASGICLNVLATASKAGDATLGTDVFSHFSKQGTTFQRIHFELLTTTYMNTSPPDLKRALHVLTIMSLETFEPTVAETRSLFRYLQDKPALVQESLKIVQNLHQQGRRVPIAVINLLIECYAVQKDLDSAMKLYKLIHTFTPIGEGAKKSVANIETFNLLLKACRIANPPDSKQAVFIVSELLALRVMPNALTFDRLILVLVESAIRISTSDDDARSQESKTKQTAELLEWAFRHFTDMRAQDWLPRYGTIEKLATQLARVGDVRCWDVVQAAEDNESAVASLRQKKRFLRRDTEVAWQRSQTRDQVPDSDDEQPDGEYDDELAKAFR